MKITKRKQFKAFLHFPIRKQFFFFAALLAHAFDTPLFPQPETENPAEEIAFTGEEAPKTICLSSDDFPKIESPKFQPLKSEKKAGSQEELEEIRSYNEKIRKENEIWQQYQKDMEKQNRIKNYPKNLAGKVPQPESLFYAYEVKKDKEKYLDSFHGLYARFQTSQGSLASINRLSSPAEIKVGQKIILPVMQGLFIPLNPDSTLEVLLQKEFSSKINLSTPVYEIDGTSFYFLPDLSLSQTLMAFFHDTGMQLPLSKKIVTSEFGYRTSPISGTWKFHAGIDLAAPLGTEVFACKHGIVSVVSYNEIYGNYIDIRHEGKTTSRYAHLSKTLVNPGQRVSTGQTIGLVGSTGASTGPHLHFEVRENGTPQNPADLLKK